MSTLLEYVKVQAFLVGKQIQHLFLHLQAHACSVMHTGFVCSSAKDRGGSRQGCSTDPVSTRSMDHAFCILH